MWKVVSEVVDDGHTKFFFVNDETGVKKVAWSCPVEKEKLKEFLEDLARECIERDYLDAIEADIAKRIRESGLAWAEFSEEDIALLGERIKRFNSDNRSSLNSTSRRGEDMRWQLELALDRAAKFLGMDTSDSDWAGVRELSHYTKNHLSGEVTSHPSMSERSSAAARGRAALRLVIENAIPIVTRHRMNVANMRMPYD
jgi:hypothetical protein